MWYQLKKLIGSKNHLSFLRGTRKRVQTILEYLCKMSNNLPIHIFFSLFYDIPRHASIHYATTFHVITFQEGLSIISMSCQPILSRQYVCVCVQNSLIPFKWVYRFPINGLRFIDLPYSKLLLVSYIFVNLGLPSTPDPASQPISWCNSGECSSILKPLSCFTNIGQFFMKRACCWFVFLLYLILLPFSSLKRQIHSERQRCCLG